MSDGGAYLGLDIGGQSIKGIRLESDGRVSRRAAADAGLVGGARRPRCRGRCPADLAEGGTAATVGAGTPGGVDPNGSVAGEAANIPAGRRRPPIGDRAGDGAPGFRAQRRQPGRLRRMGGEGRLLARAALRRPGHGHRWRLHRRRGASSAASDDKALEIGHVIVYPEGRKCACGRSGCVEAYASGPSIGRIAVEMAAVFDTPLARAIRDARRRRLHDDQRPRSLRGPRRGRRTREGRSRDRGRGDIARHRPGARLPRSGYGRARRRRARGRDDLRRGRGRPRADVSYTRPRARESASRPRSSAPRRASSALPCTAPRPCSGPRSCSSWREGRLGD